VCFLLVCCTWILNSLEKNATTPFSKKGLRYTQKKKIPTPFLKKKNSHPPNTPHKPPFCFCSFFKMGVNGGSKRGCFRTEKRCKEFSYRKEVQGAIRRQFASVMYEKRYDLQLININDMMMMN
jgi:hypothetical protein